MSGESETREVLTPEELTARLAAERDITTEELAEQAAEVEIAPPEDATVVEE